MTKQEYFPLAINSQWKYISNLNRVYIYKVTKNKNKRGIVLCHMDMYCSSLNSAEQDLISSFVYIKKKDIVYLEKIWNYKSERIGEFVFEPPIALFKLPFKTGNYLKSSGFWGKIKSKISKEILKIMGENIKTYKVSLFYTPPNGEKKFTNFLWFARGIGMVRLDEFDDHVNGYDSRFLVEYKILK